MTDNATAAPRPPAPRRGRAPAWLLLAALLAMAAALGWRAWTTGREVAREAAQAQTRELAGLAARVDALRTGQRSQAQRLQQAEATNRLLRNELIGVTQRAALLEDSVDRLADRAASGAETLRLDEVALLLNQGQLRLDVAGDLEGARRLYLLAGPLLETMDAPAHRDLRQVLAQETAALVALGDDPAASASAAVDAAAAVLATLPTRPPATPAVAAPWWRRWAATVVDVRPSDPALVAAPGDRTLALAALDLDIAIARAAIARRDAGDHRAALVRVDRAIVRLWPRTPQREALRQRLATQRDSPLRVASPTLGSTLAQLRALRGPSAGR